MKLYVSTMQIENSRECVQLRRPATNMHFNKLVTGRCGFPPHYTDFYENQLLSLQESSNLQAACRLKWRSKTKVDFLLPVNNRSSSPL